MAVPNYTYLKMKMPGRNGIITITSSFAHALTCERSCCDLASTIVASAELKEVRSMPAPTAPDHNEASTSTAFKAAEAIKDAVVDDEDPTKTTKVGTELAVA